MPLIRKEPPAPAAGQDDALSGLLAAEASQRWSAARAAWSLPGGIEALKRALAVEKDVRVREAIFTSLARAASPESVAAVTPYVRVDDAGLRTAALDALRAMPDAVRPYLAALLGDADADVRLLSCDIVRALPDAEASRLMSELLDRDPALNVCSAAVEVLAETGGPDVLPALHRCAARFSGEPFLGFAIKTVIQRIQSQQAQPRE